ncbi:MAG: hypothetical protein KBA31_16125 [Alphaproteobacteria bacterium]|nr:hypothetical protein [Alphaproteobacteria bacterium]
MRFLVLAALLSLAALAVRAGVAESSGCESIAGALRGCPRLPAVTVGGDLRVEVVTRERTLTLRPRGDEEPPCPDGKCVCKEVVQHFDFKGPVPGFRAVNDEEGRAAAATTCTTASNSVLRAAVKFSVTAQTVSTVIYELDDCRGCNGSCHGAVRLSSFDAKTGARLVLADAVVPQLLPALKARLIETFVAANAGADDKAFMRKQLANDLNRDFAQDGVYVESGAVFVNLNTWVLSCAEGSFHPMAIPVAFLSPGFRARL